MVWSKRILWGFMTVGAVLVAGNGLLILSGDVAFPFLDDLLAQQPMAAYAYLIGGSVALLLGAIQFSRILRSRWLDLHIAFGWLYFVGVLIGGVGCLYMAVTTQSGLIAQFGFTMLGVLWLVTAVPSLVAVFSDDITTHRRWIIRNYSLTYAAVTMRVYMGMLEGYGVDPTEAYQLVAWLCWVPNLVLAEWLFIPRGARTAVYDLSPAALRRDTLKPMKNKVAAA